MLSFRKTPLVMALVAGMIAVSIGVLMTSFTIYHFMSSVPLAHKQDVLFGIKLDTHKDWPHDTHKKMVSYKDLMALMASDIPIHHSASYLSSLLINTSDGGQRPFYARARVTTAGLFPMFEAPFLFGSGWDKEADDNFSQVAVLNKDTNEKMFGGQDSVGKSIQVDGKPYKVVGVLNDWNITPRLYDLKNTPFKETEQVFVPFSLSERMKFTTSGNIQIKNMAESDDPVKAFLNSDSIWIPYWVEFNSSQDAQRYRTFLSSYVSEQQGLGRIESGNDSDIINIADWLNFHKLVSDTNTLIVGLAVLFVLVCGINIMGLLSAKSFGRMKEFSIYRALGASRSTVLQMQMVEVLMLGLVSGVVAIFASLAGLSLVKAKFSNYDQVAHLDITLLLLTVVVSILVCVLAYLYPVIKASRVNPVAYLK